MDKHPFYFIKAFLDNEKLFFTASPSGNCKYIFVTVSEFSAWDCGTLIKLFSDFNEHQVWRLIPIFVDDRGVETDEDDLNGHRSNYYYIECQHFGNAKVLTAFDENIVVLAENERHPNQQWSLTLAGNEGACEIGNRHFDERPLALLKDDKGNFSICIFDKSKTTEGSVTFVWFLQNTVINVSLRYQDSFLHDGLFFLNSDLVSSHLAIDHPNDEKQTNISKFTIRLENHVPGAAPDAKLVYVRTLPDSEEKRNEIWNSQLGQQASLSLLHLFPGQSEEQIKFRDDALTNLKKQVVENYCDIFMPLLWILDAPDRNLEPKDLSAKPLLRHQLSKDGKSIDITVVVKNDPDSRSFHFELFYLFIIRDGVKYKIIDPTLIIRRATSGNPIAKKL